MFHNSSNLYRNYNMTRSHGAGRDVGDIAQNIVRTPVNVLVIAPARLVNQIFNLNHQIDYIRSRHERRVDKRIADEVPLTSAEKAALDAQQALLAEQARHAEQAKQEQSINAFHAALEGFGMYFRDEFRPDVKDAELKEIALGAMKKLLSQDLITKDVLNKFKSFQSENSDFAKSGQAGLPPFTNQQHLCQAAIGQAWIDAGLCDDNGGVCQIDSAVPGFEITKECGIWYHQAAAVPGDW
jgi:hypothetical protein